MLVTQPQFTDVYKISHAAMYPQGTQRVYAVLTPRENSYFPWSDKMVVFGIQYWVKKLRENWDNNFFHLPKSKVVEQFQELSKGIVGPGNDMAERLGKLHDLGYLPIDIRHLPEGIRVNMGVPILTIENTVDEFYWLPNFLETECLSTLFPILGSASMAFELKKIAVSYGRATCDNLDHIPFQMHDFSMRSHPGMEASTLSGMGHLTCFSGTDTISAIVAAQNYYNAEHGVGMSVPASEHAVAEAYGKENEREYFKQILTKVHPSGIVSIVSDTWDIYNVLNNIIPTLKDEILARDGKFVVRPDSGDMIEQVLYTVKSLDKTFGSTVNSKGYRVLDPHVGVIYGEGATIEKCEKVLEALAGEGYASSNIVFGVGGFAYSVGITRDTFSLAFKTSAVKINGVWKGTNKEPITAAFKKSPKGFAIVDEDFNVQFTEDREEFETAENELANRLAGIVCETPFNDIRLRLEQQL